MADDTDSNKLIVNNEIGGKSLNVELRETLSGSTVIRVDGIPKVKPKGFIKIQKMNTDIFTNFGKIVRDYYPKSENGATKDYMFIEYETHECALKAVDLYNKFKLYNQHTFLVQLVSDYDRIATLLQPLPGYSPEYFSNKPNTYSTYNQYYENKSINNRTRDWLNNIPIISDLEKSKLMAESQLVLAEKKIQGSLKMTKEESTKRQF